MKVSVIYSNDAACVCLIRTRADLADPGGHGVCAGRAVVGVDDDDGDDDGGDDEHHGEEHVLPDEGDGAGGGRDQLHDDQQEDSERQQDGDGQSHLLTWTHRCIEFRIIE